MADSITRGLAGQMVRRAVASDAGTEQVHSMWKGGKRWDCSTTSSEDSNVR
ncbi:MAG: hypothetical protein WA892_09610 [Ornithinimicrobium sp.]